MECSTIIITGPKGGRKTSMLYALCSLLDTEGSQLGGVIQVAHLPNQVKDSYTLSDQGSGTIRPFLVSTPTEGFTPWKRFWIDYSVFEWVDEAVRQRVKVASYITFDEVGELELSHKGFDATIRNLLATFTKTVILVVREQFLDDIMAHYFLNKESVEILYSTLEWDSQFERILS